MPRSATSSDNRQFVSRMGNPPSPSSLWTKTHGTAHTGPSLGRALAGTLVIDLGNHGRHTIARQQYRWWSDFYPSQRDEKSFHCAGDDVGLATHQQNIDQFCLQAALSGWRRHRPSPPSHSWIMHDKPHAPPPTPYHWQAILLVVRRAAHSRQTLSIGHCMAMASRNNLV